MISERMNFHFPLGRPVSSRIDTCFSRSFQMFTSWMTPQLFDLKLRPCLQRDGAEVEQYLVWLDTLGMTSRIGKRMSVSCAFSSTIDIIHKNGLSFDGICEGCSFCCCLSLSTRSNPTRCNYPTYLGFEGKRRWWGQESRSQWKKHHYMPLITQIDTTLSFDMTRRLAFRGRSQGLAVPRSLVISMLMMTSKPKASRTSTSSLSMIFM